MQPNNQADLNAIKESLATIQTALSVMLITNQQVNELKKQLESLIGNLNSALVNSNHNDVSATTEPCPTETTALLKHSSKQEINNLIVESQKLLKVLIKILTDIDKEEAKKISGEFSQDLLIIKPEGQSPIELLPLDILKEVLAYLSTEELMKITLVSKKFKHAISSMLNAKSPCLITLKVNDQYITAAKIDFRRTKNIQENTDALLEIINKNTATISEFVANHRKKFRLAAIISGSLAVVSAAATAYVGYQYQMVNNNEGAYQNDTDSEDQYYTNLYYGLSFGIGALACISCAACVALRKVSSSLPNKPGNNPQTKLNRFQKIAKRGLQFSFFNEGKIPMKQDDDQQLTTMEEQKPEQTAANLDTSSMVPVPAPASLSEEPKEETYDLENDPLDDDEHLTQNSENQAKGI